MPTIIDAERKIAECLHHKNLNLDLRFCQINDLALIPNLFHCVHLLNLNLSGTKLKNIDLLFQLTDLQVLNISYNQIQDLSVLSKLPKVFGRFSSRCR